ncbi:hypothetical protein [Spirosoma sp.]|uniref:hypothetical protein n=1 Tax=Spirosoma sp. TaxID=1899569 RepID=UPI00260B8B64|nr:hypothetical protein [Spirosoma sp.]MCX6216592.1 hypothetical protein [Spirosoma sp.]
MSKPTIKEHYQALKASDKEAYKEFNSQLAKRDKLTYFKRSVIGNPKKSLTDVYGSVSSLMIRFLGFSQKHFDTNTLPESINIPNHELELV